MARPRLKLPKQAAAGEVITINTLLRHQMESGLRTDKEGTVIPRNIINKFECLFNNTPVFSCDIEPATAASPYLEFRARVEESGTFKFIWTEDDGTVTEAEEAIEIS